MYLEDLIDVDMQEIIIIYFYSRQTKRDSIDLASLINLSVTAGYKWPIRVI